MQEPQSCSPHQQKKSSLLNVVGTFAFATLAQSRFDAALFAAARKALPASISTNEINQALEAGLWHSNQTAIAIGFTNSIAPTAFIFTKQPGGNFSKVIPLRDLCG